MSMPQRSHRKIEGCWRAASTRKTRYRLLLNFLSRCNYMFLHYYIMLELIIKQQNQTIWVERKRDKVYLLLIHSTIVHIIRHHLWKREKAGKILFPNNTETNALAILILEEEEIYDAQNSQYAYPFRFSLFVKRYSILPTRLMVIIQRSEAKQELLVWPDKEWNHLK